MFMSMAINKNNIIDSLYKIMCTGTTTAIDSRVNNNDYFKRRVRGFKAEIEFEKNILSDFQEYKFYEGGQLWSRLLDGTRDSLNIFYYTTFDTLDPENYVPIYKKISVWSDIKKLLYIQIIPEGWISEDFVAKDEEGAIDTQIIKPKFKFYEFNKELEEFSLSDTQDFDVLLSFGQDLVRAPSRFKLRRREQFEYFNEYELNTLIKIYSTRYFLDHKKRTKRMNMIDLDGFLYKNEELILVEIKEKTPILGSTQQTAGDTNYWKYGWDTRRILWYLHLQNNLNLKTLYAIRQINNRDERAFIKWDCIMLKDFLNVTSWSSSRAGGGGEDTITVPYNHFQDLESIL